MFIDIPNEESRLKRWGPETVPLTVPEPSISAWRRGSAIRSKMTCAGALMVMRAARVYGFFV